MTHIHLAIPNMNASIAQWQSVGLVNQRSWVQSSLEAKNFLLQILDKRVAKCLWPRRDSNTQPSDLESDALPLRHGVNWYKVPPRFELGSLDSKSRVLTITPWNPKLSWDSIIVSQNMIAVLQNIKHLFPAGFEPATLCVWSTRDNRYTKETRDNWEANTLQPHPNDGLSNSYQFRISITKTPCNVKSNVLCWFLQSR